MGRGMGARGFVALAAALVLGLAGPAHAQNGGQNAAGDAGLVEPAPAGPTYATLMDMAENSGLVVIAQIADQAVVQPERAPGLAPGKARLYLEAETESLLAGEQGIGAQLAFLADRDLAERGRAPRLKGQRFVLFARPVPGRRGELQLIGPSAMLPASPMLVERVRGVLRQRAEARNLPEITGIREVISVAGNLAGESETQLFLKTKRGDPVSLNVIRRPDMEPAWGVSWTEIVDQSVTAPAPETPEWYRLACFLPSELPGDVFLQDDAAARARAREDYAFILQQLGPCARDEG